MKKSIWNFTELITIFMLMTFYTLGNCQKQKETEMGTKPWIGKWTVFEGTDSSGVKFSERGVYHYYKNGTFASQLVTSIETPAIASDPSTPEEYQAAFDVYRAGYGTYSVNEEADIMTYQYSANMRPHRIGRPTEVAIQVKQDILTLNYNDGAFILKLKREKTD
jgi:hypothetical protein